MIKKDVEKSILYTLKIIIIISYRLYISDHFNESIPSLELLSRLYDRLMAIKYNANSKSIIITINNDDIDNFNDDIKKRAFEIMKPVKLKRS